MRGLAITLRRCFAFAKVGERPGTASVEVVVTGTGTLLEQQVTDSVGGTPRLYPIYPFNFVADSTVSTLTFSDTSSATAGFDTLLDCVTVTPIANPVSLRSRFRCGRSYQRCSRWVSAGACCYRVRGCFRTDLSRNPKIAPHVNKFPSAGRGARVARPQRLLPTD